MYDSTAKLVAYGAPSYDEYGNETLAETEHTVYVQPRSVYASEFYSAGQNGQHPSITFDIAYRGDYDGQKLVRWQGKEYSVIRADWNAQRDRISLVCEERVNNG